MGATGLYHLRCFISSLSRLRRSTASGRASSERCPNARGPASEDPRRAATTPPEVIRLAIAAVGCVGPDANRELLKLGVRPFLPPWGEDLAALLSEEQGADGSGIGELIETRRNANGLEPARRPRPHRVHQGVRRRISRQRRPGSWRS